MPSFLRLIILGSAAGGGYPQWNCRCAVCDLYWSSDSRVRRRTQSSIAVSADGERWALLNCSPDVREQIAATPALHPKRRPRHSPITSVVLTNGDADHVGGLLTLREQAEFELLATGAVLSIIDGNPIFHVLHPSLVRRRQVEAGKAQVLVNGVTIEPFLVPGKVPLYLERETPRIDMRSDYTIGLKLWTDSARKAVYIPGCGLIDDELRGEVECAAVLLFDGTLWQDDELMRAGVGTKSGRRMGHVPVSGADGSMAGLKETSCGRKIFIHLNNTNPLIVDGSPERLSAQAAGWEVSPDGMEFTV
jgi:pyrroloquinoline quinone biosynthesis protein B